MIQFSPIDLFRDKDEFSAPWKDEARQRLFHEAATHALAKMALDGATAEEMAGVKKFLVLLLNCAEKPEAISVATPPRLDYDVESKIAAARNLKKD